MMWRDNIINVQNAVRRGQEIHATIEVHPLRKPWLFTSIYASTNIHYRNMMWDNLENISNTYKGPCLVGGDFNDILTASKKFGGKPIKDSRAKYIWSKINNCNLVDLGFKGSKYTWTNNRHNNKSLILERLDKVFGNEEWIELFPKRFIIHLQRTHSDHNPILVKLIPRNRTPHKAPFRLETFWCKHPKFQSVVINSWNNSDYFKASSNFIDNVKPWKDNTFGNIMGRKRKLLARLQGIQSSNSYATSSFLKNLELDLQHEFNDILKIEEDYWKLRSRIMWLNDGDTNTKFFHISATNRKRRNKITFFKDNAGNWINDHSLILSHVQNYFTFAFTSSHTHSSWTNPLNTQSRCKKINLDHLDTPLLDNEIKSAVFSFIPFKSSGPDGLHPFFFQKYWFHIGDSVKKLYHNIFKNQKIPPEINKTFLCLIPKFHDANNIKNFRPIGLCNTIYKIITKILANRIKPFLDQLISPYQASFMKNRRASDNAIIIQEMISKFNKLKGKQGHMILKIDLEKGFDRLE